MRPGFVRELQINFCPFCVHWLLIREKTYQTMANINNTSRRFLRPSFYHWFTIMYSANVTNRFLRPDLPRACPVYEVIQTTIDVPVWGLIFSSPVWLCSIQATSRVPRADTGWRRLLIICYERELVLHRLSHVFASAWKDSSSKSRVNKGYAHRWLAIRTFCQLGQ